jgi:hypothetical protein
MGIKIEGKKGLQQGSSTNLKGWISKLAPFVKIENFHAIDKRKSNMLFGCKYNNRSHLVPNYQIVQYINFFYKH